MKLRASPGRGRFKIVEFTNPSGALAWRVSGTAEDGERVRVNFPSKAAAEGERDRLESEFRNGEIATRLVSTRLLDTQAAEAERAFALLPAGKSLAEAVAYFAANYREPLTKKSLDDAFAEFLDAKGKANKREDTTKSLRNKVGFLVSRHGKANVSEILSHHVNDVVYRTGTSPVTSDNVRRALFSFFAWAKNLGYCATNPCDAVDPPRLNAGHRPSCRWPTW